METFNRRGSHTGVDVALDGPVVVLTGAGISTDSGIPDFRSGGGVWERFDPDEFRIERLLEDPDRFWERRHRLVTEMGYLEARPNRAHQILAQAAQAAQVSLLVTQNVDGLHQAAGTPPERLLAIHGDGRRCRCMECDATEGLREVLARRAPGRAPSCTGCDGLLKPDVVLFGEPVRDLHRAMPAVDACATLLVVGTSLQVHPVAGLAARAVHGGSRLVIVNRDRTPYDADAETVRRPIAEALAGFFPAAVTSDRPRSPPIK